MQKYEEDEKKKKFMPCMCKKKCSKIFGTLFLKTYKVQKTNILQ